MGAIVIGHGMDRSVPEEAGIADGPGLPPGSRVISVARDGAAHIAVTGTVPGVLLRGR